MITLRAELNLFPGYHVTLEENDFLQVLDHATGGHYRLSDEGIFHVGGEPLVEMTWTTLLDKEITCIEFNSWDNKLEVYVK